MSKHTVLPTTELPADAGAADPRGRKFAQVLDAARDELLQNGFDRASMDSVATRAGVSKATLYAYFKNKDDMFRAVMMEELHVMYHGVEAIGRSGKRSLGSRLREAGVVLLTVWLSARTLLLLRSLIAAADRFEEVARAAHPAANRQAIRAISSMLNAGVEDGEIACRDTEKAAAFFMSLIGADLTMTALLDPRQTMPAEGFEAHAKWAVDVVLKVYEPRA